MTLLPLQLVPQNAPAVTGLIYFVVENLDDGRVEQRGIAGSSGVAFDRLILASNTRYRIWLLEAATLRVSEAQVSTATPGRRLSLPDFNFKQASSHDRDGDGLSDLGEFILGTDPLNPDTDGDGIQDGAEVQQGTDPLSGLAVRTGIIATADTPGQAKDICAVDDLAIVADGTAGISVFNIFNGMNPILVAQVDTPGDALAVACAGNLVPVADGSAGLAIVDLSDPPAAFVTHQLNLGTAARAVAVAGQFAFVGLANGQIAVVDLPSAATLHRFALATVPVQDLVLAGDYLYAITEGRLDVLEFTGGELAVIGSVASPGGINADHGRMRLSVGGDIAYVVHRRGYNTIDVSLPAQPRLILNRDTPQFGWKQIVANGSGLGVAAVSPNQAFDGPHHVSLYDVSDPAINDAFIAEFETPGVARAVSIYNGLAYVADHTQGLQVVNYLAYDALGLPPSVRLSTSFASGVAEEGQLMRVTAEVTDDVQVRNAEFYLDGALMATDGNFPFEHRFITPLRSGSKTSFKLLARASDTGGNTTWSDELTLNLVPDATPPRLLRASPAHGSLANAIDTVMAYVSEPILPGSLDGTSFRVVSTGADGLPGTADDEVVPGGAVAWREDLNAAVLSFEAGLDPGLYRAFIGPPLSDRAGNLMPMSFSWSFRVFSLEDRDQDGIPDDWESLLAYDPDNPDTNGDGILDGDEDSSGDGLSNRWKIAFGYDPRLVDTDGNGTLDGAEDPDRDGLDNRRESEAGTDPFRADTDGDGWNDESEITAGSDPLDPGSRPLTLVISAPRLRVGLGAVSTSGPLAYNTAISLPRVTVALASATADGVLAPGNVIARPAVAVGLAGTDDEGIAPAGLTISQPPVAVLVPVFAGSDQPPPGVTVAQPPVTVNFESP